MKVYLAALFSQKMEMRLIRDRLEGIGHTITSQWIDVEEGVDTDASEANLAGYARMDLDDVMEADVLVAFSLPRGTMHNGGGRHVEFGFALAAGNDIIICGPKGEHIFHYLDGAISHVADVDALIVRLDRLQKEEDAA